MSVRFACRCGRFVAESAIRNTDHRDDSRFYGIRTEVEWDCSRCGTVKGDEWEPQIVVTAHGPTCVGCERPVDRVLPDPIPEGAECMWSEAMCGRALYCQACFDDADPPTTTRPAAKERP